MQRKEWRKRYSEKNWKVITILFEKYVQKAKKKEKELSDEEQLSEEQ